jgi:hypothetical protein
MMFGSIGKVLGSVASSFSPSQAIGIGANLAGGLLGRSESRRQEGLQREFAQKGIQWRVADAKKAGIHPLYALGSNTPTYSPVGSQGSLGRALGAAGQDISTAIHRNMTAGQRQRELNIRQAASEAAIANDASQARMYNAQAAYYAAMAAKLSQQDTPPAPSSSSGTINPMNTVRTDPKTGAKIRTLVDPFGGHIKRGPGSPAELWEQEYGPPWDIIMGNANAFTDLYRQGRAKLKRSLKAHNKRFRAWRKNQRRAGSSSIRW